MIIRHTNISLTVIYGDMDTIVEYKNSQLLFDEYVNNHQDFNVVQVSNCLSGMDKATYCQVELYSMRNANHNDIVSVYVHQARYTLTACWSVVLVKET